MLKTSVWPRSNLFLNVFEVLRGTLPINKKTSVISRDFECHLKVFYKHVSSLTRQQAEKKIKLGRLLSGTMKLSARTILDN